MESTYTPNFVLVGNLSILERARILVAAAENAPSFGGLRGHLTTAAEFAQAVAERFGSEEQIVTELIGRLTAAEQALTDIQAQIASGADTEAAFLDHLGDLTARLEALEAKTA